MFIKGGKGLRAPAQTFSSNASGNLTLWISKTGEKKKKKALKQIPLPDLCLILELPLANLNQRYLL